METARSILTIGEITESVLVPSDGSEVEIHLMQGDYSPIHDLAMTACIVCNASAPSCKYTDFTFVDEGKRVGYEHLLA